MTKSLYGDRDTVGTIAQKAAQSGIRAEVGEMGGEMIKSCIEDLNIAITSKPFGDRSFYITIHEKKDAQLKNTIQRRVIKSLNRPYPEPNTSVFWTSPKGCVTRFCWSLPHWSVFPNVLADAKKYGNEQLEDIMAYSLERMEHFGFMRSGKTAQGIPTYVEKVGFKDRKLKNKSRQNTN